jgi:hypothetical protein
MQSGGCSVYSYGLGGPWFEPSCERDFPYPLRLFLRPTHPPVQWVPGLKRPGRGVESTTYHHLAPKLNKGESYTSVPPPLSLSLSLSLSVPSWLVIGQNLPFRRNFLETRHSLRHHRNCWVFNAPSVGPRNTSGVGLK